MKTRALCAAVCLICTTASFAMADTYQWTSNNGTNWFDQNNWLNRTTNSVNGVPDSGDNIDFTGGSTPRVIDFFGSNATVNNATIGNFSATTGQSYNNNPAAYSPAIFQSSGGAATLNFNNFTMDERGSDIQFDIALNGNTFQHTRKPGDVVFNETVTLTNQMHQKGRNWTFNDVATLQGGVKLEHANLAIGGNGPKFHANAVVNTPTIDILDIGVYNANVDGGMGGANTVTTLADGGKLFVNSNQTSAGTVNIINGSGGVQSGVTHGYALFDAPSISLANLGVNTAFNPGTIGAEVSAGSEVIVTGNLSGAGAWGGSGRVRVTGSVSPGNSIDTITGSNLTLDGGSYEFEIADPDGAPGGGWDLIAVDDLSFGNWTLNILDAGLTRDIDPSEEFVIATMNSTNFDPANATITAPADWYVGDDALFLNADGNLVLTNISNVAQAAVPEPQSLGLWVLAGLLLSGSRVLRKRG